MEWNGEQSMGLKSVCVLVRRVSFFLFLFSKPLIALICHIAFILCVASLGVDASEYAKKKMWKNEKNKQHKKSNIENNIILSYCRDQRGNKKKVMRLRSATRTYWAGLQSEYSL